MDHLPSKHTD